MGCGGATIKVHEQVYTVYSLCYYIVPTHTHTHTHTHTGVLEVFGSWNKVAPRLESATFEVEVEKQLEEAMFEQEGQSITVVASDTRARTGFYPPHAGGH